MKTIINTYQNEMKNFTKIILVYILCIRYRGACHDKKNGPAWQQLGIDY